VTKPQEEETGAHHPDPDDGGAEWPVVVDRARTAAEGRAYRTDLARWEQHGQGDAPREGRDRGHGELPAAGLGEPTGQPEQADDRRQTEDGERPASLEPAPGEEAHCPANDDRGSLEDKPSHRSPIITLRGLQMLASAPMVPCEGDSPDDDPRDSPADPAPAGTAEQICEEGLRPPPPSRPSRPRGGSLSRIRQCRTLVSAWSKARMHEVEVQEPRGYGLEMQQVVRDGRHVVNDRAGSDPEVVRLPSAELTAEVA